MAILTEAAIKRAFTKAVKMAISKAIDDLKRRVKRAEMIDKAIESVIPRQYSGYVRDRMKSRIRKNLRKNHVI